ncbi:MAG: thiamine pyrophosphate-binding protein [Nitrospira sp. CG24A]|nr:MAG: thiamine pyrophosphate-binding protein [Nitrospira sp. CG24A]
MQNLVKVSDYVASFLADFGVRHVFMVTGGGAMHLNDAFGRETRIQYICNHHEQACAMAAEGYARVTGKVGVLNVTTGPGSINALNGVFGAWTDSIPLLVISGQVKLETCMASYQLPKLRQLGDQEADIIPMVQGITKYAVMVKDPQTIRFHLEKALYLAKSGRPGPCWIDIPIDVQAAKIDPSTLPGFTPVEGVSPDRSDLLTTQCREVAERLMAASRPVMMVGSGIRLSGAVEKFERVIAKLRIPVTTAWTAHDLIPTDHELFCGRPGTVGDRPGNFTVQNSDLLIVIGSRLNIRQVSYNWKAFARHAYKVQVDVDEAELSKPTVRPDLAIPCDATAFLEELDRQLDRLLYDSSRHAAWLAWCRERVARYPVVLPRHREFNGAINPYHFLDRLCRSLEPDDVIVCGNGAACVVTFQVAHIKRGQRLFCNSGSASMGYDLPAAIGAAVAREGKRVICLAGDGSIQMNIQELQTLVHHQLPIKVFVLNNDGYLSIRQSQKNFFNLLVGESEASGVSFPDMVQIGQAYGIPSLQVAGPDFLPTIERVLATPGPQLCQVTLDPDQQFEPKLSSKSLPDGRIVSAPLEDLYPFLERDELFENLLVPPMEY